MASSSDQILSSFLTEIKEVEARDSIYTSRAQIDRLLRPGASYANLNPFEVLLIDPLEGAQDASPVLDMEHVKRQYKKLSILIHPDKNPLEERERAQSAFDIVTKAYKSLEDESSRARALEMVQEALFKLKQDKKERAPEEFRSSLRACTLKLFADQERKRKEREERDARDRKRKREEEIKSEEEKREKEEWIQRYEESREERVTSWKSFQKGAKKKVQKDGAKGKMKGMLKPPKPKPEEHK